MMISVIIPVCNERERINDILESVKSAACGVKYEVIVADGDPSGSTIITIAEGSIIKIKAPKGRALQMNAAAAHASGDILLFLHADTILPENAFSKIIDAFSGKRFIGGAFDLGIRNSKLIFRIIGATASLKHRITRVPYGDQAIFMLRNYFNDLGGYPEIPLMEDVELMKSVKRKGGRIIILPEATSTSSRKWETEGILYTIVRNWIIQTLYMFGVSAELLVKYYYKQDKKNKKVRE